MVAGSVAPLQILKEKTHQKKLTFHLTLKNPDAICFSELSIERDQAYYFHNQGTGSKLHPKAYVSPADKVTISEVGRNPFKLEKPFLAVVDIYLEKLWEGEPLDIYQLPIECSKSLLTKDRSDSISV